MQAAFQAIVTESESIENQAAEADVQVLVVNELAILKNRKEAAELVLGNDKNEDEAYAAMEAYIARFHSGASGSGSIATGRARLGLAPPCRSYKDLKPLTYFKTVAEKLHYHEDKAAIDVHTKAQQVHKDAVLELKAIARSAIGKAKHCVETAKTSKAQQAKAAGDANRRSKGKL
eukprot:1005605-Lingulodinium_polyedra.AAC.1